jgi:phage gp45-like
LLFFTSFRASRSDSSASARGFPRLLACADTQARYVLIDHKKVNSYKSFIFIRSAAMTSFRITALSCAPFILLSVARADPPLPAAQQGSLVQQVALLREEVNRLKAVIAAMPDGDTQFTTEGDRMDLTGGDQMESVGGDLAVQVGGSYDVQVGHDQRVFIDGDLAQNAAGNVSVQAGDAAGIVAGSSIIIDAGDELILRSGGASIVLKQNGDILITGANISIQGSSDINIKASGDLVLKGRQILQN